MNLEEITGLIKSVASDDEVFQALVGHTADRHDVNGEIIPISMEEIGEAAEIYSIIEKERPKVLERLTERVKLQHHKCCGFKDPD